MRILKQTAISGLASLSLFMTSCEKDEFNADQQQNDTVSAEIIKTDTGALERRFDEITAPLNFKIPQRRTTGGGSTPFLFGDDKEFLLEDGITFDAEIIDDDIFVYAKLPIEMTMERIEDKEFNVQFLVQEHGTIALWHDNDPRFEQVNVNGLNLAHPSGFFTTVRTTGFYSLQSGLREDENGQVTAYVKVHNFRKARLEKWAIVEDGPLEEAIESFNLPTSFRITDRSSGCAAPNGKGGSCVPVGPSQTVISTGVLFNSDNFSDL